MQSKNPFNGVTPFSAEWSRIRMESQEFCASLDSPFGRPVPPASQAADFFPARQASADFDPASGRYGGQERLARQERQAKEDGNAARQGYTPTIMA